MSMDTQRTFGSRIAKGDSYDPKTFTYIPVVIIGAGESGIAMGCQLKEKLGFDQFRIFDRQAGIGGTWWINRYPGVACDVPALFYSFSFCQNPSWTSLYPTGREIVTYLQGVAEKYEIVDKIHLNTDVTELRWNDGEGLWDITIRHQVPGVGDLSSYDKQQKIKNEGYESVYISEERIKAKVVTSCVGGLVEPKEFPDHIAGRDQFKGEIFHSARWRYDVDLKDKDVVVVGTGCSAAQFVPRLRPQYGAKSVTQIMRSPPWTVPKLTLPVKPDTLIWMNKNVPGWLSFNRFLVFAGAEWAWRWFGNSEYAARERAKTEKQLLRHLHKKVPEKYWEILEPNYAVGCKRRIFDAEWFPSLSDPFVELTTLPLTALHEKEVTLGPGRTYPSMKKTDSTAPSHEVKIPADVIILANGFETTKWLHPLEVYGRNGKTLHDVFDERGGPQMYRGTSMDGFPNFWCIFGPNTATGHSSVILASENMVMQSLKFIKPILAGDVDRVEVKREAEVAYTADIQAKAKKTVWGMGGCANWYIDPKNGDWNSTAYPYSQIRFTLHCMFPTWNHWDLTYTPKGMRKLIAKTLARWAVYALIITGILRARKAGVTLQSAWQMITMAPQMAPMIFKGYLKQFLYAVAERAKGYAKSV